MPKPVWWLGDSRKAVKAFSAAARHEAGMELFAIQLGADPTDWKPMRSIGSGVCELRIHAENEYRLIYVAKFEEAVYVLHAFTKKTRETSLQDVRLAQRRYREMIAWRGVG
jgi:phage-related protein